MEMLEQCSTVKDIGRNFQLKNMCLSLSLSLSPTDYERRRTIVVYIFERGGVQLVGCSLLTVSFDVRSQNDESVYMR